ncbi:MAG TPA: hypothetical protein VGD98_13080 [Ktedonobacteraceae bacterium]
MIPLDPSSLLNVPLTPVTGITSTPIIDPTSTLTPIATTTPGGS